MLDRARRCHGWSRLARVALALGVVATLLAGPGPGSGVAVAAPGAVFSNPAPIALNSGGGFDFAPGAPSQITVSGLGSRLTGISVTLKGITGIAGGGLAVMLVAPDGVQTMLMVLCGGNNVLTGVDLTFDPTSTTDVPAPLVAGTYRTCPLSNLLTPPAPPAPGGGFVQNRLTNHLGSHPNGTWSLWVLNFGTPGASFAGGWQLNLTADTPPATTAFGPFVRVGAIAIPASAPVPMIGPASPYPAPIAVSGAPAGSTVISATVTLGGLTHGSAQDLSALLVSPDGRAVNLITHCGAQVPATNLTLTLGLAGEPLPSFVPYADGTFRPTGCLLYDTYAAPAPPEPYGSPLSSLTGAPPNGQWSLFVEDFGGNSFGQLTSWGLTLFLAPPATPTATATSTATRTATATATSTATPTPTLTPTPTSTSTSTGTPPPTATPTPTGTGTAGPTPTSTATAAATATGTPLPPTATPTPVVPELPPRWLFATGLLALGWLARRR